MATTKKIDVPLNRVEGDLEVTAELRGGVVADAWVSGTMYRGFEKILTGRGARDGLVITPRICGICTTSHLTAAAQALEAIAGATPPPDALRVRRLVLAAEHVQSDVRHGILSFAADFASPAWSRLELHEEAVRRFAPLAGETTLEAVRETRQVLDIVTTFGGQWPHSSYMVPGGIVSLPSASDLVRCRLVLERFRAWYEAKVLGAPTARWGEVRTPADLDAFVDEFPGGVVGFLVRFCRAAGLDRAGSAHATYLSFGGFEVPDSAPLFPAGFSDDGRVLPLEPSRIAEDVTRSWYHDSEAPRHPEEGETRPYATGREDGKYSWAKAPRYAGRPAETGPFADAIVAAHPLFTALGANVLSRALARLVRPAALLPAMERCLADLSPAGPFYASVGEIPDGAGAGLVPATRGALGHWVSVKDGAIERYQIITPTAWNASPRDAGGLRGPMEEALVGTEVRDEENPVELGHVVRSFDACLVCTVHAVVHGRRAATVRVVS